MLLTPIVRLADMCLPVADNGLAMAHAAAPHGFPCQLGGEILLQGCAHVLNLPDCRRSVRPAATAVAQAAADRERKRAAEEAAAAAAAEPKLSLWQKARALTGAFQPAYWQALAVVAVLYFARFDASFLSLRAKQVRGAGAVRTSRCRVPGSCLLVAFVLQSGG
jgi:hypothetical protein